MNVWAWIKSIRAAWSAPVEAFDSDFPDSDNWTDRIPLDADCPDTQPTFSGALDHATD
jgi:hypothetical protein